MAKNIGPFRIGRLIGSGAAGKVKLAFHKETGERVAIKIVHKRVLTSTDPKVSVGRARIEKEMSTLELMDHPNVLKLIRSFEADKYLFLITEYFENGDLFSLIENRKIVNHLQALVFFQQIIFGLDYLHNMRICHRDLKPENLLLDNNHNLKIADFGMCHLLKKGELVASFCGSTHYAAPEVISRINFDGRKADVWSCGVILYLLLCGRFPFSSQNPKRLFEKVKSGHFVCPKSITLVERDLIKRMLTVDPKRRISIKEIKNHEWFTSNFPEKMILPKVKPLDKMRVGKQFKVVDLDILKKMKFLGSRYTIEELKLFVANEGESLEKTLYYLYLKMRQKRKRLWKKITKPINNNKKKLQCNQKKEKKRKDQNHKKKKIKSLSNSPVKKKEEKKRAKSTQLRMNLKNGQYENIQNKKKKHNKKVYPNTFEINKINQKNINKSMQIISSEEPEKLEKDNDTNTTSINQDVDGGVDGGVDGNGDGNKNNLDITKEPKNKIIKINVINNKNKNNDNNQNTKSLPILQFQPINDNNTKSNTKKVQIHNSKLCKTPPPNFNNQKMKTQIDKNQLKRYQSTGNNTNQILNQPKFLNFLFNQNNNSNKNNINTMKEQKNSKNGLYKNKENPNNKNNKKNNRTSSSSSSSSSSHNNTDPNNKKKIKKKIKIKKSNSSSKNQLLIYDPKLNLKSMLKKKNIKINNKKCEISLKSRKPLFNLIEKIQNSLLLLDFKWRIPNFFLIFASNQELKIKICIIEQSHSKKLIKFRLKSGDFELFQNIIANIFKLLKI
ncbi:protein kinase [Anaeramoeba flamelloides]|uniref:Protein kinase n=1 Tax=Anaeramoeba flamelloides TaxID=1746091 RepID=A0ABQ8XZ11_9EUKA|nr:protein kinase [Anaeramoeba flamelloides]